MKKRFIAIALGGLLFAYRSEAGAILLKPDAIPQLLAQCSRSAPAKGEGSWNPSLADVADFEKALPSALKRAEPARDWSQFPGSWQREYVGIIRGGRKFIYGNFVPKLGGPPIVAPPTIVCDGGPAFFGAEWDMQARRISHLDFNGVA